MTLQEIFTRVRKHLLRQGCKARKLHEKTGNMLCRYRGDNGTMCAVGCLITDDEYTDTIETYPVDDPAVIQALIYSNVIEESEVWFSSEKVDLLRGLQCIHDDYDPEYWRDELADVAVAYNLKVED